MKKLTGILIVVLFSFYSCSVLEKSSMHGFKSGEYVYQSDQQSISKVYADLGDEKIDIYNLAKDQVDKKVITIPFLSVDSLLEQSVKLGEKSLDVDITTILFKYRPSFNGLPPQLLTDLNVAIYTGWRHDAYHIKTTRDPLGIYHNEVINRGYDFGMFAGTGTTLVNPFSTRNSVSDEYNGMIIQFGIAGFLESRVASFGISTGFDFLLGPDSDVWIYKNKPWVGFIIGFPLN